jgi:tetratricopeptide (TPR) repeat protein
VAPALAAGLLAALHPLHAEAVCLVTARNTLLAAAAVTGAALLWERWSDGRRRGDLVACGGVLAAGLLCKETALLALPQLAVRAWSREGGLRAAARRQGAALAALGGVGVAYLALRAAVLRGAGGAPLSLDLAGGARNLLHSLPVYAGLVVFPARLQLEYRDPGSYLASPWVLALAWAAMMMVVILLLRSRRPVTRYGLAWAALHLVPVSTLVPFPSAPIAERYLYLPATGLWLVAADQLARAAEASLVQRWRRPALAVAAVLLAVLGARTVARTLDWKDDLTLFRADVRADPESPWARHDLGVALGEAGDAEGARRELEAAVALDPTHAGALGELARWHGERGHLDTAEGYLRRLLAAAPGDAEAHYNLGLVLERTGRFEEAIPHYEAFVAGSREDAQRPLVERVRQHVLALRRSTPKLR